MPPPRPRPTHLSQRHPWLRPLAVRVHQARRHLRWLLSDVTWAGAHEPDPARPIAATRVTRHSSLLLRELSGDEMRLQHQKVVNLRLASARTDGVVIAPGETFSFNKVVGSCTARKGYVEGMRLSDGRATTGVGGGICQLANLVHWMVLHTPLTVLERSEHSFDPFPDKQRVLPWGVGCSIVYNYVDLVFRNDTDLTFELRTWVDVRHLRGEIRADRPTGSSYRVQARGEELVRHGDEVYRSNEIWRTVIDRRTGRTTGEELVKRNRALVRYEPDPALVREAPDGRTVLRPPRDRAAPRRWGGPAR